MKKWFEQVTYNKQFNRTKNSGLFASLHFSPLIGRYVFNSIMDDTLMKFTLFALTLFLSGCVVMPVDDHSYDNKCEISSDRKILKVVDAAKGTNSYYSISGVILLPITGVISGIYVGINNIYHLGEEKFTCGGSKT
ncbi:MULTISPECIES: hypothetical protein [unclassified Colwellia]|uniref:hypothetical protein n=1 Tax=unclassified Colwellia TaxID=196834 RepID=UPI00217515AD|nr:MULTISPECIES: hypothetical protein [unclassified Colwellia]